MDNFIQDNSFIISSSNAINELSNKDEAKILIISDSHGNSKAVHDIVLSYGKECSALCFAGDGVIDIVNLLEIANTNTDLKNKLPKVISLVSGNCDDSSYNYSISTDKKIKSIVAPPQQIIKIANKNIYINHGHRLSVDYGLTKLYNAVKQANCTIGIFGHIHMPVFETFGTISLINPGSVSRARGNSKTGFAIAEIKKTDALPKVKFYSL